jgi:hypothetical protein
LPGSANDFLLSFLRSFVLLRSLAMRSVLPRTEAEITSPVRSDGDQLLHATGRRISVDSPS